MEEKIKEERKSKIGVKGIKKRNLIRWIFEERRDGSAVEMCIIRVPEAHRGRPKSVRIAVCSREPSTPRNSSSPAEPSIESPRVSFRSLDPL